MKIKTKIKVTKKDIKRGEPTDPYSCPIALAVKRTLKVKQVCVTLGLVEFLWKDVEIVAPLPIKAETFIDRFDEELEVEPFSFILRGHIDRI